MSLLNDAAVASVISRAPGLCSPVRLPLEGAGSVDVKSEVSAPAAAARIAHVRLDPGKYRFRDANNYWLDLALTSRTSLQGRIVQGASAPRLRRVGSVLMMPAGCSYEFRTPGSEEMCMLCNLSIELFRTCFGRDLAWTERGLEAGIDLASPRIRALLLRLGEEIREPGLCSDLMIDLITTQLAIEIGRFCGSTDESQHKGGLAPWRLRLIDERLRAVGAPPTLPELAKLCNLSVRQLTRGFQVSRGCSIGTHMEHARIIVTKRLLQSDQSIKEVAYAMGYSSPSNFSFAFRRSTGMTPIRFRNEVWHHVTANTRAAVAVR
jgi:AraC family transcriptional regulator